MRHALAIQALIGLSLSAWATDYYVSPTGSDSNPGTQAQPFRQISKAISVVAAGDTVYIEDGTYNGGLTIRKNGTAGAPVTFKATGSNAVVRAGGTDTIFVDNSSYVVIDGLRSFNASRAALRVSWSDHVTVRNCVFGDNGRWGLFTDFSNDLAIENNTCYGSVLEHGIYHSNSGDNPILRGNVCTSNNGAGIHINGDLSSGGDGTIHNALVENNVLYNNNLSGNSAALTGDGVVNSTYRNNLLYNNHGTGIVLYRIDGGSPSTGNVVANNTIDTAADGRWGLALADGAANTTIFNNILLTHSSTRGSLKFMSTADLVGLSCDFNILTTNAACVTTDDGATTKTFAQWRGMGFDTNSSVADQSSVFVNWTANDFHLVAGSPAIDSGTPSLAGKTAPATDYEDGARPTGAGNDMGADEYGFAGGGGGGSSGGTSGGSSGGSSGGGGAGSGGGCGLTGAELIFFFAIGAMRKKRR